MVSDITYLSELTPHHFLQEVGYQNLGVKAMITVDVSLSALSKSGGGVQFAQQLTSLDGNQNSVSCVLIEEGR